MKIWFATVSLLLLTNCAKQIFEIRSEIEQIPSYEDSQAFFFGGLGQEKEVDAAEICGDNLKVAQVEVERTALDNVLSVVTLFIYTPATARVYCQEDKSS